MKEKAIDSLIDTGFENEEQNSKITDYFNKIPTDSLFLSSICPEVLIKEEVIEKTSEEGNENDGKKYNCFQSDNIFTGITEQKVHVDPVHKGARYNCQSCDRKFSQKWQLFVHIKTVHGEKNSDNQAYEKNSDYQAYENKKTIKSFNCLSCDKTFKKGHLLKVHKESVHEGKKIFMSNLWYFLLIKKWCL